MGCTQSSSSSSNDSGSTPVRVVDGLPKEIENKCKVVTIGDKSTGKTAIVQVLTKGVFPQQTASTVGAAFATRDVITTDGTVVRLQIWDTAGEELYRSITRSFYKNAAACFLVFDLTVHKTFESLASWLHDFRDVCPDSLVVLVGNKLDLAAERRAVTREEAEAFCKKQGIAGYWEVSAKTNTNIGDVFNYIAVTLKDQKKSRTGAFSA